MATIYRFIVEQKNKTSSGRQAKDSVGKGAAKKGKWVSIFGGEKGGVEHNRKMRAINPLINRATGGLWEKGMRLGRATTGLIKRNTETGKLAMSGPAIAIIIAMAIQAILKIQTLQRNSAQQRNSANYKMLENGVGNVRGEYELNVNMWSNRVTYNQNK
ncbi:MAG: hypothetical protein IJG09_10015 [Methanobrevibacter sp.]|nr:hypothetical protein [Methanobrevibacter sp.]